MDRRVADTTWSSTQIMANNKKRKRKPTPPAAGASRPRPQKRTGPSQSELQRIAHRKAQRQDKLRRAGVTAGVVLLGGAVVAALFVLDRRGDAQLKAELTAGSCEVDTRTDPTRPPGQNHMPNPTFAINPPAGGDHAASAARAGVYAEGSTPDDGLLVHSLEHGYVIAWHRPDLPQAQLQELTDFQARHDDDVIIAERSDLAVPVAATAWGQRLLCQEVEAEPLQRFFDEHVGNGPEDVARG